MKNRKIKSLLSIVLCIVLILSNIAYADTTEAEPVKYTDIVGNKYERQLREWIVNSFIKGYPDGDFKPENQITRSEFIALANRVYGFTEVMEVKYLDVSKDKWYYNDAMKATKAGFIQGANGKLMPLDNISRQELAVILLNLTKNEKAAVDETTISSLTDGNLIPAWSKVAVSIGLKNKLFDGFIDKTFNPTEKVTRLEAVVTLDRAFKSMYRGVYTAQGVYGPETGVETLKGDVVIIAPNVTLRNTIINGNLILRETIGEGNAYLDNVVVRGETIIKGGGANSIVIKNSTLGKIIVIKEGNTVRIVAIGSTTIGDVYISSDVRLVEEQLIGTGFNDVFVLDDIPEGANVVFEGAFGKVQISSPNINVTVQSGTMGVLSLTASAVKTNINITQQASVTTMNLHAAANVTGKGTIGTVNINVSGTTIEQNPTTINIPTGIQATVAGKPAIQTSIPTPASGGGGGGGGGTPTPSIVPITAISSISGIAKVGVELTAGILTPSNATVIYQWQRANAAGGTYINITAATTNKYTPVAGDAGKFIRVVATGTGNYSGTVASIETAAVLAVDVAPFNAISNKLKAIFEVE